MGDDKSGKKGSVSDGVQTSEPKTATCEGEFGDSGSSGVTRRRADWLRGASIKGVFKGSIIFGRKVSKISSEGADRCDRKEIVGRKVDVLEDLDGYCGLEYCL